jgi:hypothetical protein
MQIRLLCDPQNGLRKNLISCANLFKFFGSYFPAEPGLRGADGSAVMSGLSILIKVAAFQRASFAAQEVDSLDLIPWREK